MAPPTTAIQHSAAVDTIGVVVAVPHPMMRAAIGSLIESDPDLRLVESTADVPDTARCLRAHHPDVLLIARRLALPATGTPIADLQSVAPGVAVIVTGMETDPAYVTASRAAGAIGFVSLDHPPENLPAAVKQAARRLRRAATR